MSSPVCTICNRTGFGVLFPMTPKTEGFKFGTICDECDDRRVAQAHMRNNKQFVVVVEALVEVEAPDEETAREMAYEAVNDSGWRVDETHVKAKGRW